MAMAMAMAMATATSFLLLVVCLTLVSFVASTRTLHDTRLLVPELNRELNNSRRNLGGFFSCQTGNPIDDCWRCDNNWNENRQKLAECAIGFGKDAYGGKGGEIYVVTDSSDHDAVTPKSGTLRHAVIQDEPLWIIFDHDMTITLKQELIINSFKTIDGRGANVHVAGGAGFTIQYVNNVIVHGIHIHDTEITGNANVRSSTSHFGWRTMADGDAISIFGSKNIWVDHCTLSNSKDGLVDAVEGSTAITISNNLFTNHNEVMLLGHSDAYTQDEVMRVTIAFNHFGEGLVQRMPRCRRGYFHVVNNDYTHYEMYAIGASAHATVLSESNRFVAPDNINAKEVIHLPDGNEGVNLRTSGDLMLNGAVFTEFGTTNPSSYERAVSLAAKSCHAIDTMTSGAGVLPCKLGQAC